MKRIVFLDTGPLGVLTNPGLGERTIQAIDWSLSLMGAGHRLIVPAIADFELRRELERSNSLRSLAALDAFNESTPGRYLPLTDTAIKRAARLWARARNSGTLPADPKELNGDVLIAAQVLDYQTNFGLAATDLVIATTNVGHLSLFAPADIWTEIQPES